jgi:hypothetical protein
MEEALRKPAKISIWEVEGEQTREAVDEIKPDLYPELGSETSRG